MTSPIVWRRRVIPARDWISDCLSPCVSVLSDNGLEVSTASDNNLTFTELLQPFSKLLTDITFKDHEGVPHSIHGFNLNFQDFKKDPAKMFSQKLISDMIAKNSDEPMVSRTFANGQTLEAPGFTPWFDTWMKVILQGIPAVEHEFLRNHLACLFAVNSKCDDVLAAFRSLSEQQHKHQHEKPYTYPQFMSPAILKYYVLVHDVQGEVEEKKAQEIFKEMQSAYGANLCHLLFINSRESSPQDNDGNSDTSESLSEYWLAHSHRFCNIEVRQEGVGLPLAPAAAGAVAPSAPKDSKHSQQEQADAKPTPASTDGQLNHPLAFVHPDDKDRDSPSPPHTVQPSPASFLKPATLANIATRISTKDVDRIRILVREFCLKGLIPHMERMIRSLHDTVTNRKSRSLFSGAKRWFGQKGPGSTSGTSVVYGKEAPELQTRKLADFCFLVKLYKTAFHYYHLIKKDFQSDEAWNYYAGATEMCALSQFMQNDQSKKNSNHYMEDCILKYLQVCQMPDFALRATLFDALCLKHQGQFQAAADSYMRMTNEGKDLRSSLLLEQAAYCYLLATPPLIRKYSFHIILAAYRFSKVGQKKHCSRTYHQGFQVYREHGWTLSEDHILYTLGHQALLLKDYSTATQLFNELLAMEVPNLNSLQQMCHLREFLIVHHMREKELRDDKEKKNTQAALITVPRFKPQQAILNLSSSDSRPYEALKDLHPKDSWQLLEKSILEQILGQELMFLSRSCQSLFTPISHNNLVPQVVIGEPVQLLLPVENVFQTNLILKRAHLLWEFSSDDQTDLVTNHSPNAKHFVTTNVIDAINLERTSQLILVLSLTALQSGELRITGIDYGLKTQFPQAEATDYTIHGRQELRVRGPRLNLTKAHKTSVVYGDDHRLMLAVRDKQPQVSFHFQTPEVLFQGELCQLDISVQNCGQVALSNLVLVSNSPGTTSFGSSRATHSKQDALFDFPVVDDNSLALVQEDGTLLRQPLDFLCLPLDQPLKPGTLVKRTLWMRAPEHVGPNKLTFYFYYERAEDSQAATAVSAGGAKPKKSIYRILLKECQVQVLPSLAVSATLNRASYFDCLGAGGDSILVQLSNIVRNSIATLHDGSKVSLNSGIAIRQISLVSSTHRLTQVQSHSQTGWVIQQGESAAISLKSNRMDRIKEIKVDVEQGIGPNILTSSIVHLSDGGAKNRFEVHQPPFVDFLKPYFKFEGQKALPLLKEDLVIVFWQSVTDSKVRGQIVAVLKEERDSPDQVDSGRAAESAKKSVVVPVEDVHVSLSTPADMEHDFQRATVCLIPCTLRVENNNANCMLFSLRTESNAKTCFTGCVSTDIQIEPGQVWQDKVYAPVTFPGLHRISGLSFALTRSEDKGKQSKGSIPLETSVLVQQKQPS